MSALIPVFMVCICVIVLSLILRLRSTGQLSTVINNIQNLANGTTPSATPGATAADMSTPTPLSEIGRQRCNVGSECQRDDQCTSGKCKDWGHFDKRCCPLNGEHSWDGCVGLGGGDACKFDWQCSSEETCSNNHCTGVQRTLETSELAVSCEFDSGIEVAGMIMSELFPMVAGEVIQQIIQGLGSRLFNQIRNRLAVRMSRNTTKSSSRIAQEISEMSIDEVCDRLSNMSRPRSSRLARAGAIVTRSTRSARTGVRVGAKALRFTGKAIKSAVLGVKTAATMGTKFLGKALLKAGGGPVGAALLVFDIVFVVLDVIDVRNENKRRTQTKTKALRDQMESVQYALYTENGMSWPPVFEACHIFRDEVSTGYSQIYDEYFTSLLVSELQGTETQISRVIRFLSLNSDFAGLNSAEKTELKNISEAYNEEISNLMNNDGNRNARLKFLIFNSLRERNRKTWNLARYAPWWYYASPTEVSLLRWDDIKVTEPQTKNNEVFIKIVKRGTNSGYCERHTTQEACMSENSAACSFDNSTCTSGGLYYEQHITAYQLNPEQFGDCLVYKQGALFKRIDPCNCICTSIGDNNNNCQQYSASDVYNENYSTCVSQNQATARENSCNNDIGQECSVDSDCSSNKCKDWGHFDKRCCPEDISNSESRWDGCANLSGGDSCKHGWQCSSGECMSGGTCSGSVRIPEICTRCDRSGQDLTQLNFDSYFTQINASKPEQKPMYKLRRDLPTDIASRCSQNRNAIFRCSGGKILQAVIQRKSLPVFPDAADIVWGTQYPTPEPERQYYSTAAEYSTAYTQWIEGSRTFTHPEDHRNQFHIADIRGADYNAASNYNSVPRPSWWILEACYQRFLLELAVHPGICISRSAIPSSALQFGTQSEIECDGEDSVWLRGVFIWKNNYYVAPLPRPWHDEAHVWTPNSNPANNDFSLECTEAMCHKWNALHMNIYKIGGVMEQIMPPEKYGKFVMPMVAVYSSKYPTVRSSNGNLFQTDGSVDYQLWNPQMEDSQYIRPLAMLLNIADVFTACVDGIRNGDSIYRTYPQWSAQGGAPSNFSVDISRAKDPEGTGPSTTEASNPWIVIDGISFDMDTRLCIYNPSGSHMCSGDFQSPNNRHAYTLGCSDFCKKYRGNAFNYETGDYNQSCSSIPVPGQGRCDRGLEGDHSGIGDCRVGEGTELLENMFSKTLVRSLS